MRLLVWLGLLCQMILGVSCAAGKKNNNGTEMTTLNEAVHTGKNIFAEDKTFNSEWDILQQVESVTETEAMQRGYVSSSITFKKCVFKGSVSAYKVDKAGKTFAAYFQKNISFIDCIFEDACNFRGGIFAATCTFQGCSFLKGANFQECTFMNDVFFNDTKYGDEAQFQNCVMMKKSNWMKARFESNASFQGAAFYYDAQFSTAEFQKYADFTVVTFQMSCFFNYCVFGQQAVFNSSMFAKRAEMLSNKMQKTEMRNCIFILPPKFYQNEIAVSIDFSKSVFTTGVPDLSSVKTPQVIAEEMKTGALNITSADFMKAANMH